MLYWPFMNRLSPGAVACLMKCLRLTMLAFFAALPCLVLAQQGAALNDLQSFTNAASWKMAAHVTADYSGETFSGIKEGTGIIVNAPTKKQKGTDISTKKEYGDVDISLEFLLPANSNSGIFLQSRYEIQLRDSWGKPHISAVDNGGIYPRYDSSRGTGNEEYEGYAPRINVSRAPGLWQKLSIAFQAPRFDANGKKTANAKILKIELNGTLIHENIELTGPTRGTHHNDEVAKAPLLIQGHNGPVALRNVLINDYYGAQPAFSDLTYSIYKGKFEFIPDYSEYEPEQESKIDQLTTSFLTREEDFLVRYTGKVHIKQAGTYLFLRETNGGGYVKVNNEHVSSLESYDTKPVQLEAGSYPFEMGYTKPYNWFPTSFGLKVSADNVREFLISDPKSLSRSFPDPVHIHAATHPMMRSFIDLPDGKRLVHAISVGGGQQLHYSYDLDNGALFQAWRGEFLDAGSMWVGRGDGSAKPLSAPIYFNKARFPLIVSEDIPTDTAGSAFHYLGYETATEQTTIFKYSAYGASIDDAVQIDPSGKELKRKVTAANAPGNLQFIIAEATNIEELAKGLFAVDDRTYFIRFDNPKTTVTIKDVEGKKLMIAPLTTILSYSIVF